MTDRNQQVARIDYERDSDVDAEVERQLVERIDAAARGADALLVSDYLKGTITRQVVDALLRFKSAASPLVVDPKIPHLDCYAGATLVTPNHHEAEAATHRRIRTDEDARAAATRVPRTGPVRVGPGDPRRAGHVVVERGRRRRHSCGGAGSVGRHRRRRHRRGDGRPRRGGRRDPRRRPRCWPITLRASSSARFGPATVSREELIAQIEDRESRATRARIPIPNCQR